MRPHWSCVIVLAILVVVVVGNGASEEASDGPKYWHEWIDERKLSLFAPVSEAVDNEACRSHSQRFVQGVMAREAWAVRMLDASSKPNAGLLSGNLVHLGDFDECLAVRGVTHELGSFSGRHCLVTLGESFFSDVTTFTRLANVAKLRNMAERAYDLAGDMERLVNEFGATFALCIPSSCTSRDLESHLRSEMRSVFNVSISVSDLGCSSREDEETFAPLDWVAILVIIGLLVAVASSTWYDCTQRDPGGSNQLLASFSLCSNTRALLKTSLPSDTNLTMLDGIRVICALVIFLAHCSHIPALALPSINAAEKEKELYQLSSMFFTSTVVVDAFFVLSGLLVSYNFFKDRDNNEEFNLVRFYLRRFLRLTPSYAVMLLLSASLLYHTGEGPLWKFNLVPLRDGCRSHWVYNLLYIHNYYPSVPSVMDILCMCETWYLSVDMQCFWLAPLVLYPLYRWPILGKWFFAMLVALGTGISFIDAYVNETRYTISISEKAYITTHTRFTTWLIGVGLGYLLHYSKHFTRRIGHTTLVGGNLLSLLIVLAAIFAPYHFLKQDYVYDKVTTSLLYCLMRPAFALGVSWLIFVSKQGYAPTIQSFLSWPKFQVLSRLCFALYMTQISVIRMSFLSVRTSGYVSVVSLLIDVIGCLVLSLVASYILHVVVEAPCCNLEKIYYGRGSAKNKEKKVQ